MMCRVQQKVRFRATTGLEAQQAWISRAQPNSAWAMGFAMDGGLEPIKMVI